MHCKELVGVALSDVHYEVGIYAGLTVLARTK
jgi:hypothetical protein